MIPRINIQDYFNKNSCVMLKHHTFSLINPFTGWHTTMCISIKPMYFMSDGNFYVL